MFMPDLFTVGLLSFIGSVIVCHFNNKGPSMIFKVLDLLLLSFRTYEAWQRKEGILLMHKDE